MDIAALLNPTVSDRETLRDFTEALSDQLPGLERTIADLRHAPDDPTLIASLFRGLHTIKGDAAMCKLPVGVMIAHPLESVLARLRSGEIAFSPVLAELLLLGLDRLEQVIEALNEGLPVASLKLPELAGGLEMLAQSPVAQIETQAARIVENVTGFRPIAVAAATRTAPTAAGNDTASDLALFRTLALLLEERDADFAGRTERLLQLALQINSQAGKPVDPVQLEAAIYTHDAGMMMLPESVWLKAGALSADDVQQLRQHPVYAAELLARMPGWSEAARMVRQHHEKPDGSGYPAHLADAEICAGAKIIAIVDAFESVMLKQRRLGQGRSLTRALLRAVAEINANEQQFASDWVPHFNAVVRTRLEGNT